MAVGYGVGGAALIVSIAWFCGWYAKSGAARLKNKE